MRQREEAKGRNRETMLNKRQVRNGEDLNWEKEKKKSKRLERMKKQEIKTTSQY